VCAILQITRLFYYCLLRFVWIYLALTPGSVGLLRIQVRLVRFFCIYVRSIPLRTLPLLVVTGTVYRIYIYWMHAFTVRCILRDLFALLHTFLAIRTPLLPVRYLPPFTLPVYVTHFAVVTRFCVHCRCRFFVVYRLNTLRYGFVAPFGSLLWFGYIYTAFTRSVDTTFLHVCTHARTVTRTRGCTPLPVTAMPVIIRLSTRLRISCHSSILRTRCVLYQFVLFALLSTLLRGFAHLHAGCVPLHYWILPVDSGSFALVHAFATHYLVLFTVLLFLRFVQFVYWT